MVTVIYKPSDWTWHRINVPQLIRKTIDNPDEMVKTDFDHTIYELTGNMIELAKVNKDNDLLDKKIINNQEAASLDLANMDIEQELELYLRKIVRLSEPEIQEVMEVYYVNT